MTLLVGLVGVDGIVLACDRLINVEEQSGPDRTMQSKFTKTDGAVCCWAGARPAALAADEIRKAVWTAETDKTEAIRKRAQSGWAKFVGPRGTTIGERDITYTNAVLVAFDGDCSLWEAGVGPYPVPQQILDGRISGDVWTTTQHLKQHYSGSQLPISQLVILAAHAICTGHRENSGGIGGLQVAIIPKGGSAYFLSREQEQELQGISDSIHERIGSLFNNQRFDYRPVTPPLA